MLKCSFENELLAEEDLPLLVNHFNSYIYVPSLFTFAQVIFKTSFAKKGKSFRKASENCGFTCIVQSTVQIAGNLWRFSFQRCSLICFCVSIIEENCRCRPLTFDST